MLREATGEVTTKSIHNIRTQGGKQNTDKRTTKGNGKEKKSDTTKENGQKKEPRRTTTRSLGEKVK